VTPYGGPVLLDMSAWARVLLDRVGTDHDFDTISESSGLRVRSVWIAPRGSMP